MKRRYLADQLAKEFGFNGFYEIPKDYQERVASVVRMRKPENQIQAMDKLAMDMLDDPKAMSIITSNMEDINKVNKLDDSAFSPPK